MPEELEVHKSFCFGTDQLGSNAGVVGCEMRGFNVGQVFPDGVVHTGKAGFGDY